MTKSKVQLSSEQHDILVWFFMVWHLGKSLISETRFGSRKYVFSVLALSPEIMKQLIIYLVYSIYMCFSQHVMTFEIFLILDVKI